MKSLKEKFGKFEMTKEQVKAVKGGADVLCLSDVVLPGEDCGGSGGGGTGDCQCRPASYCTYIDPYDDGRHSVRYGNVRRDCRGMCC
jgi:hypothetical protein